MTGYQEKADRVAREEKIRAEKLIIRDADAVKAAAQARAMRRNRK